MTHPRRFATTAPDHPAAILWETGQVLTYGQLEARANQGAHYLRSLGIGPGQCIAVWLPNVLEYFEVYWAAQRAGLYITPISTRATASEAAYILADCEARLLVTSAETGQLEAFLAHDCAGLPGLAAVVTAAEDQPGLGRWESEIARFPADPIADESAGYQMVYSSGTTGRPKGVRIPLTGAPVTSAHHQAERMQARYAMGPDTVYLSPAPLYHAAPLVYSTSTQRLGGTAVVMRKFSPEGALAAIEHHRVTVTQMVPTMFLRLLRLPEAERRAHDVSSLTHVIHAAAPCPIGVKEQVIAWLGPIVCEYYAGSEGNGSTYITAPEWLGKKGSVGRPDSGAIHICDEAGHELPAGEAGTIYFSGGPAFHYHKDPEKTAESRNPLHPGWTTLGDVGYVDADGYLFLTDRKSFMIISGGLNIYPQEIENLLVLHPKVADVAVIGVPSEEMGEEVRAVVQPLCWDDAGEELAAELIAWCREHLSHVKCPRRIDFDPELPRAETGKLYKRLIRDRYWAGHATPII